LLKQVVRCLVRHRGQLLVALLGHVLVLAALV
jgi:hypothetical protein